MKSLLYSIPVAAVIILLMYFYTWYSICVMVGAIGGMFVSCIVSNSKMADLEEELMRKDEIISSLKPHSGGVSDYIPWMLITIILKEETININEAILQRW